MKKILFFMTIFATLIFTNCEKENEATILSDFIIGEWVTDTMEDIGDDGLLYGTFTANGCTLEFVVDGTLIALPELNYSVDNEKNQITTDEPDFDAALKSSNLIAETDQTTFSIDWEKGNVLMTWTNVEEFDHILEWTRVTD